MVYVLAAKIAWLISPVRKKGPVNSAWFLTERLSHCIYTFVLSIFPVSFFFQGWMEKPEGKSALLVYTSFSVWRKHLCFSQSHRLQKSFRRIYTAGRK